MDSDKATKEIQRTLNSMYLLLGRDVRTNQKIGDMFPRRAKQKARQTGTATPLISIPVQNVGEVASCSIDPAFDRTDRDAELIGGGLVTCSFDNDQIEHRSEIFRKG